MDLHQKSPIHTKLKRILAIHHEASLASDNTIRCEGKIYLIKERLIKTLNKKIRIEKRMDGKIYLLDKDHRLEYKEVEGMLILVELWNVGRI